MWEQINKWYLFVRAAAVSPTLVDDPHEFLAAVKEASHLFVGVTDQTMTHGEGWHFGRLGRVIERADQTSRIVDAKQSLLLARPAELGASLDENHLSALLRSVSALEMYRKRHGPLDYQRVLGFLMLDPLFPRSIRHCLDHAQESLRAVTGDLVEPRSTQAERVLGRLAAEVRFASVEEILAAGLHEHLDRFQLKLNEVDAAICDTFFAGHGEVPAFELQLAEASQ
jgi:uncharacterized alpha-E superfamily protein